MATLAEGERTQAQVAAATAVDPRNMAATIKSLREKHWVRVRPHPDDARSRLLSLTPAGKTWWVALQPELRQERDKFFHSLTVEDIATLEALLRKLEASHALGPNNATGQHGQRASKD